MAPAEEDVSKERSNTYRRVEQEDMLVCFGSVHDTQIHKTNAPPGADDMSQDLFDDESGVTHSATASNQKESGNEKEQESTHLVQKSAQQPALSSAVEVPSIDTEELLSASKRLLDKEAVAMPNDSDTDKEGKADTEADNRRDTENEEDTDNWSVLAEQSQGSD